MLPIFLIGVAIFVALLVTVFRLGIQRKRTAHMRVAWLTLLVVMITLVCVAMLVTFGLRLRRKPLLRPHHRWMAILFVISLIPTVGTGTWLLMSLHDPPPINQNQDPAALNARRDLLFKNSGVP